MAYYGNEPAKVALKIGSGVITTTEIQDGQVYTADILDDAITSSKIDDDGTGFQVGSLGIGTSVTGIEKLTVGGTASFSGAITGDLTGDVTGDVSGSSATVTGATQSAITEVGTLTGLTVNSNSMTLMSPSYTVFEINMDSDDSGSNDDGILKFTTGSASTLKAELRYDESSDTFEISRSDNGGHLSLDSSGNATFSGQCQASSFLTGDLILKSPVNNGHYTIWEEEEYLAIRNELTGKKYKFVLEEIDE